MCSFYLVNAAEWIEINLFADSHNLEIIEDCAQAHGAKLKDQFAGTFGKAGYFSFYLQKI